LEIKSWDLKYWHLRFVREYNRKSEISAENLEELYYKDLRSSLSTRKPEVGPEEEVDADERDP